MIRRIKVLTTPESVLAIGRTKKSLRRDILWLGAALVLAACCLLVEFVTLLREPQRDILSLVAVALGLGVLVLLAVQLRRLQRQLLTRDRIVFDRARAVVQRNDEAPFCSFEEINQVVLEAVHDTEDHFCGYLLYLAAASKGRLIIGEGLAKTKDLAIGQAIAAFTGKPLARVGELATDLQAHP